MAVGRRRFLKAGAAGSAAMLLPQGVLGGRAYASAEVRAAMADTAVPSTPPLTKFVDPLPALPTAVPDPDAYPGADYYEIAMRQSTWRFHRDLAPAAAWGYWAADPHNHGRSIGLGYLGPIVEAVKDRPSVVKYRTELPTTHLFQGIVDQIHQGNARFTPPSADGKPAIPAGMSVVNVVHKHGGFTAPQCDGRPAQWFAPGGAHGPEYATLDPARAAANEAIFGYTNSERASMLWYHDHAMAITSLNVYAGLSGAYIVRDPAHDRLDVPQGEFEIPLILQDRTFQSDGSLAYTLDQAEGADTPVVNGKAYPFLAVQPRRYRLRILNASNGRFWRLSFAAGTSSGTQPLPFWVIGTDGGFRKPVSLKSALLAPAERIDVLVDFSGVPRGANVTLANDAPVHYPDGNGAQIPEIMQFRVTEPLSGQDRTTPPEKLVLPSVEPIRSAAATRRREFVVCAKGDALTLNSLLYMEPCEDFAQVGSTEIWEYINPGHVSHPMHVHLVNFQVLDRQPLDASYQADFATWVAGGRKPKDKPDLAKYLSGPVTAPDPEEALAYKDTVKIHPMTVTRIVMKFDAPGPIASIPDSGTRLPAPYIQHCHILEHEDNDMMRPWTLDAGTAG